MQLSQHRPLTFVLRPKIQQIYYYEAKPSVPFDGQKPAYLLCYRQQSCLAGGSRTQETKSTILRVTGPCKVPKKAARRMNPMNENCHPQATLELHNLWPETSKPYALAQPTWREHALHQSLANALTNSLQFQSLKKLMILPILNHEIVELQKLLARKL
jgi:hypothetical protein